VRKRKSLAWGHLLPAGRGHQRGFLRVISNHGDAHAAVFTPNFFPARSGGRCSFRFGLCWLCGCTLRSITGSKTLAPGLSALLWTPARRGPMPLHNKAANDPERHSAAADAAWHGSNGFLRVVRHLAAITQMAFVGSWHPPSRLWRSSLNGGRERPPLYR